MFFCFFRSGSLPAVNIRIRSFFGLFPRISIVPNAFSFVFFVFAVFPHVSCFYFGFFFLFGFHAYRTLSSAFNRWRFHAYMRIPRFQCHIAVFGGMSRVVFPHLWCFGIVGGFWCGWWFLGFLVLHVVLVCRHTWRFRCLFRWYFRRIAFGDVLWFPADGLCSWPYPVFVFVCLFLCSEAVSPAHCSGCIIGHIRWCRGVDVAVRIPVMYRGEYCDACSGIVM